MRPSERARTSDAYELNIRRVRPHLGHIRLDKVKPADIQATYTVSGETLAPRTVLHVHRTLHEAFKDAVRWEVLGRNPTDAAIPPRVLQAEQATLSAEQVAQLLESTSRDRLHTLWLLLVTTGLRHGEVGGLKWSDLDLDAGRLTIRRQLQRPTGQGLVFSEPKTATSRRTIPLASAVVGSLRTHRVRQIEERLAAGPLWEQRPDFQDLVFTSAAGAPLDPARVNDALRTALERVGLPRIRVHDLRHTCATLLFTEFQMHPKQVQALLGHSTYALTMNTYTHVIPSALEPVAENMERLLRRDSRIS